MADGPLGGATSPMRSFVELWRDAQCGNPAVPKSELVTKLDRTAGKRSADLSGGNCLTAVRQKADNLAMQRMVIGDGTNNPGLDCVTAILVSLVANDGVRCEKVREVVCHSGVVGLEEASDWGR